MSGQLAFRCVARWIFALLLAAWPLFGQTAVLRGRVTDESGAVIPNVRVTLTGPSGAIRTTRSGGDGTYSVTGLAMGDYTVQATAPNLSLPQPAQVSVRSASQILDLQLKVVLNSQQVTVQENTGPTVAIDPSSNASGVVLRDEDLQSLSDDPDDLQADLQALAGPSAGPSGGAIFIDGFSGGELPPKESIREIRINQNPFSPEFDKLGYGRIEVFTKPGADKYRGTVDYNLGNTVWNSRNPYAEQKAPLQLNEFEGNAAGPINKRMSFTLDAQRNLVNNGSIINAVTLDPKTLAVNPFTDVFTTPQRYIRAIPRIDYQLNDKNTLTVRYGFTHSDINGAGIGGFDLTSRGYHAQYTHHTVQLTETAVLGSSVNETRFQYYSTDSKMLPNSLSPEIQVLGSFNDGGSQLGRASDRQNSFELQNYTSMIHGAHAWKFGVRLRGQTDDSVSPQNFNGTFSFGGGLAPELNASNQPVLDSGGQPILVNINSIERYRRTVLFQQQGLTPLQIRTLGGGATQFSINAGIPELSVNQVDAGAFVGDDWRLRPNVTVSLGLRYETQTNIHDWRDIAPRAAIAWALGRGGKPKTVLRGGFGTFYDRFVLANTLAAERYNGIVQQQYVVTNPDFYPNIPAISSLSGSPPSQVIQQISSSLRAPYILQSAITLERQLPKNTTLAVTYTNSHGVHILRSNDINAPLPGTYVPGVPASSVFPLGHPGPVFLAESSGIYNQNQLIANVNSRVNANVSLFGFYVLNKAMSSSDGINTFPANPYNFVGEYGPAATDVRHRVSAGGSINTKWNLRFSPFVIVQSGMPFNITTGSDVYGTTMFNGRPGIASDPAKPGLIATAYGLLDPNPGPDEKILMRNSGRGPGLISVNLRVAKTFGFGPERGGSRGSAVTASGGQSQNIGLAGAGPGSGGGMRPVFSTPPANHRYSLIVSMSARNLLNHTNPGPIVGNITSPLFGFANQMYGTVNGEGFSENANNRRLEMQIRFRF